MGERLKSTVVCYAIVLPSLLLLMCFVYAPVVWGIAGSFYQFEVGDESQFVGLANYREYLSTDPTCWPSMATMLIITFFAACVRLTVPLIVAKMIYSLPAERSRYLYRIVFLMPIVVPGVAIQLIWSGLVYSDPGLLNEALRGIGLESWTRGWLSDPQTALAAAMLVGFPFVGGFDVLVYYAGLSSIPDSVNEAAMLDGCTGVRKFLSIDVPLVMSQLKLILILTVIGGLQGFEGLFILTRGGPGFKTTVPGLWMYFNAFSFQRMGYACAIGVLLFLMIFGLTLLNLKYFKTAEELQGQQA
ncbi:MAG TPA: sugar ABC transporter permease [Planctomycetota bacterium]